MESEATPGPEAHIEVKPSRFGVKVFRGCVAILIVTMVALSAVSLFGNSSSSRAPVYQQQPPTNPGGFQLR